MEDVDPQDREACGKGVEAEGFEQAEELLEEQAIHGDPGVDPLGNAPVVEEEEAPSVYGEADEVDSTSKRGSRYR